jgi:hypothetical protein
MPEFNKTEITRIKDDLIKLISLYVISIIILWIIFYNEPFFSILRLVSAFYVIYVSSGFFLMYLWRNLPFMERFIVGIALGAGLNGILSYYLNILGLHINYHAIVIYLICLVPSLIILYYNLMGRKEG